MTSRAVRFQDWLWQKLTWYCEERGLTNTDGLRIALADALKTQKPPSHLNFPCPDGTTAERERWAQAAKKRGVTLDELTRQLLNLTAANTLDENG